MRAERTVSLFIPIDSKAGTLARVRLPKIKRYYPQGQYLFLFSDIKKLVTSFFYSSMKMKHTDGLLLAFSRFEMVVCTCG